MGSLLDDRWVMAQIDEVVAENRHLWTDDEIRAFRHGMAWTLLTHPEACELIEKERAATAERSGTRLREQANRPAKRAPSGGGKRR